MPIVGSFAGASARAYGAGTGALEIPGLDLITSQSFSSVSSVTFDNCFSNNYIQYKIVIDASGTTLAGISLQFRASGSTYTSANYRMQSLKFENNNPAAQRLTGQSNWQNALGVVVSSRGFISSLEIMNPFQTMFTSGQAIQQYVDGVQQLENRSFGITVTNSFDGFVGTPSGGTMTGTMYVYGFSKGV
jgi:hypothetical protein